MCLQQSCPCNNKQLWRLNGTILLVTLQETYNYFYLPFCKHKPNQEDQHAWGGLGEVLQGNELINSQLDIKFKGKPTTAAATALLQAVPADQYQQVALPWQQFCQTCSSSMEASSAAQHCCAALCGW
jgi:hypothetical protein